MLEIGMVLNPFSCLLSSLCLPVLYVSRRAELITSLNGFFQSNLSWDPKTKSEIKLKSH